MKILYGVPSEGMGHATRSKVVIDYLLQKGHDVQIVSSDRAFDFLNKAFPGRVHEIKGFHIAYKNAKVSLLKTSWRTLKTAPENLLVNFKKYSKLVEKFSPQLVISDFESFSYFFAKRHSLHVISIDNMQVINRCRIDINLPKEEKQNLLIAKNIVKAKLPASDHYIITSFFKADIIKEQTTIVPPIIRREILQAKPEIKDHILVYQTSTSQKNLISILQELPNEKFLIYGFNKAEKHGNIELKTFSENGFIKDLSTSKAVISNGGFSLLSEAIFLHKPICSVPIEKQFEQFLNAAYIQKLGFGKHLKSFSANGIKAFIYDLPLYKDQLANYHQNGNELLFKNLDAQILRLTNNLD